MKLRILALIFSTIVASGEDDSSLPIALESNGDSPLYRDTIVLAQAIRRKELPGIQQFLAVVLIKHRLEAASLTPSEKEAITIHLNGKNGAER